MKVKNRLRDRVKTAIKRRQDEGASTKFLNIPSNVKWFEPQKLVKIDIIPYVVSIENHPDGAEPGELYWVMPYKMHSGVGADEKTFVCPRTFGKKCPICDYRSQLIRDDYDANKDIIDQTKARDRMLLQVIDRDDPEAGIQLWDVSYHLFGKQLEKELLNAEDEAYYDFAELKGGYTLKVRFDEKHFGSYTFWEADRIDFLPRAKDYDESILEEGYQLDKMLRYVDPEILGDIFFDRAPYTVVFDEPAEKSEQTKSVEEGDDFDDEEPERVAPEKPATRTRRPAKEEKEPIVDTGTEEKLEVTNEEEKVEKPATPRRRERRKKDEGGSKCPYGHVFGKDTDLFPECDDCPDDVWEACSAAFSKNGGE